MQPALIVGSLVGAGAVVVWRMRETRKPVTMPKIVIPPLGMSTGLMMFVYPPTRIPLTWAVAAFALGALVFSPVLVRTSKLRREGDVIMLQRSRAFVGILLGLVAVRFAARAWVEQYVNTMQTGSIFFLLAFGMVVTWRAMMLLEYQRLVRAPR